MAREYSAPGRVADVSGDVEEGRRPVTVVRCNVIVGQGGGLLVFLGVVCGQCVSSLTAFMIIKSWMVTVR